MMVYSVVVGLFASFSENFDMKSFLKKVGEFAVLASAFIVIGAVIYLFVYAGVVSLSVFK